MPKSFSLFFFNRFLLPMCFFVRPHLFLFVWVWTLLYSHVFKRCSLFFYCLLCQSAPCFFLSFFYSIPFSSEFLHSIPPHTPHSLSKVQFLLCFLLLSLSPWWRTDIFNKDSNIIPFICQIGCQIVCLSHPVDTKFLVL